MHIQGNSTKHNITAINFTLGQNFPVTMLLLQALHLSIHKVLSQNLYCPEIFFVFLVHFIGNLTEN